MHKRIVVMSTIACLTFGFASTARAGGGTIGCGFLICEPGELCIGSFPFAFCCAPSQVCGTTCCFFGTVCTALGCCPTELLCGSNCCSFGQTCVGGTCMDPSPTPTPTSTVTPTATETPTNTPIPNGGSCADPATCASGNCVDAVCCDTSCPGPLEQCNLAGREGTCTTVAAPAPALTPVAQVVAIVLLAATAAWAMRRRHRSGS